MSYKRCCRQLGIQTFDQWYQRKFLKKQPASRKFNSKQLASKPVNTSGLKVGNSSLSINLSAPRVGQFLDYSFPGIKHQQLDQYKGDKSNRIRIFGWKSLSQMIKGIKIFKQISPNDIFQKDLNDCYFLAALSAIADTKPQIINNMFKVSDNNEAKYIIQLIIGGQKQLITIDDYVPFAINNSGNFTIPLFASISKQEKDIQSWVMLIQKAFAKAAGGYKNIEWGNLTEAFDVLIGCHSQIYSVNDSWDMLIQGVRENLPMIVSTMTTVPNGSNVVATHAYTILGATQQGGNRLIELRNPFGHTEPDRSIAYRGIQQQDGIFQMEYQKFREYFNNFSIAWVIDYAKVASLQIQNRNAGIVKFFAPGKARYAISISTQLYRCFPELKISDQPRMLIRVLTKSQISGSIDHLKVENLQGFPPCEKTSAELVLQKGENYFFFQKQNKWPSKDNAKKILAFSVYGSGVFDANIELLKAE